MYNLSISARQNEMLRLYEEYYGSTYQHDYSINEIQASSNMSKIFEEILPEFLSHKPHNENYMEDLFEDFKAKNFPILQQNLTQKVNSNDNLYAMFNAKALSGANSVTRTLSTKLGLFWEEVANLSSNVVSPEIEFNIKLKGVDAIIFYDNDLFFAQMKTQRNTLTGSQAGRSTAELSAYTNPLFVSCIDNGANWTYGGPIPRIIGKQFWDMCNLDYNRILENTKVLIEEAENLL